MSQLALFSKAVAASADPGLQFVAVTAQTGVGHSFSYEGDSHAVIEDPNHLISKLLAQEFDRLSTKQFTQHNGMYNMSQPARK